MPRVKAFRAIRPPVEKAARVACVPYDVVSRNEAAELAAGNAESFLHVIRPDIDLPADTNPYADEIYEQARVSLQQFLSEGTLQQDEEPSVFLYRQIMDGNAQTGVVCCCHVDDYENNRILKHEKTRPVKEDDRTRHILTLGVHPGPLFLAYRDHSDVNAAVAADTTGDPLIDFTAPDGVQHTVWKIADAARYVDGLSSIPEFYIADGHHRAASAWRAGTQKRNENPNHTGDEEYNWFLTVLFPASQLKILAYNRIISDLNGLSPDELREHLRGVGALETTDDPVPDKPGVFCVYFDGTWHRLTVPPESIEVGDAIRSLDVAILESRVITPIFGIEDVRTDKRIDFVGGIRGTDELEKRVDSGEWACAVSMFPTSIEQLMAVSDAGEVMPPKSTWFEPKLRSGLFVHALE